MPFPDRRVEGFSELQIEQLRMFVEVIVIEQLKARTAAEIDVIAEAAATKAVAKITDDAYKAVGKSVLDKLLWVLGVLTVASYLWARNNGLVK